jgi:hypothetical protein
MRAANSIVHARSQPKGEKKKADDRKNPSRNGFHLSAAKTEPNHYKVLSPTTQRLGENPRVHGLQTIRNARRMPIAKWMIKQIEIYSAVLPFGTGIRISRPTGTRSGFIFGFAFLTCSKVMAGLPDFLSSTLYALMMPERVSPFWTV